MEQIAGVTVAADTLSADDLVPYVRKIEELGLREVWLPDVFGREIYVTAAHLLAHTSRIKIASGVAHIYGRTPLSTAQAARTLSELSHGRFILGLGISNQIAAKMHGVAWEQPVAKMRTYLEAMAAAQVRIRKAPTQAPVYLAAHGPKMLRLASELADGANTYLMPAEHTRKARTVLGAKKRLTVVVPFCLSTDETRAREVARGALSIYTPLRVYQERWIDYGFREQDFADGGSDHLVDSLFAWGDAASISEYLKAHIEAGADQIQLIHHPENGPPGKNIAELVEITGRS